MIVSLFKALCLAAVASAASIANIELDLKPKLAAAAEISTPGSQAFDDASKRWAANINPIFDAIVKVTSEQDVQETILYANERNVPFLVFNGGHGSTQTLNKFKGGIGINMRGMKNVAISNTYTEKGPIAYIQGGAKSGEVISTAWAAGKTLVAGGCDCTGFTGVTLGGGHGFLQGAYGLAIDNILSIRLVLANATALTVSSSSHPSLFWALRGAGHNFGVVTQIAYQVYDRSTPSTEGFSTRSYIFTGDKLEAVFELMNTWLEDESRPVELTHFAVLLRDPSVSSEPVISLLTLWQGPSFPAQYTTPLTALLPARESANYTTLAGINALLGSSLSGPNCAPGLARHTVPVGLQRWDTANIRAVHDIFSKLPDGLHQSGMLLEAYSVKAVQAVDPASTAYALRGDDLLAAPTFTFDAGNASLAAVAETAGKQVREAMMRGTGLRLGAYVNYAVGDEGLEAVYGYEGWRLKRLRSLKGRYDPEGRFGWYEGIV